MAGRLFFATAVAFAAGFVAVGFYDVRPTPTVDTGFLTSA